MSAPRQRIGWLLLGICAVLGALAVLHFHRPPSPPPDGLRHGLDLEFCPQVYIWQRSWTPQLKAAVQSEVPAFARTLVLARQIDWAGSQPRVIRIPVDWQTLKAARTPVAAALRISAFPGPFDPASADCVAQAARSIVNEASDAGVPLAELQVDFDAATSKLPAYRTWLTAARQRIAPIPLTFTALPTWFDSPAFAALARDAGYFVLQVHWLDRPHRVNDPLVLCDIPTARRAIEKAARFQIPFRLALPTYSYIAAFNPDGTFSGMTAEGTPPPWDSSKTLRLVQAHPAELATFVNELQANRPMSLLGIIWYRLPIDSDRLNWSWTTLRSVMAGRIPQPGRLSVNCRKTSPALADIELANVGEQDIDQAARITLTWSGAAFVAADALGDFQIADHDTASLRLISAGAWQSRLKPGESKRIGWLRLSKEADIHATVE